MEHSGYKLKDTEGCQNLESSVLQSICASRISKEAISKVLKRKRILHSDDDDRKPLKRRSKSRKEAPLCNLEERTSRSLDAVYSDGRSSSGLNSLKCPKKLVDHVSFCLDENVVKIPRRRRGFVGRKRNNGARELHQMVTSEPSSNRFCFSLEVDGELENFRPETVTEKIRSKRCNGDFQGKKISDYSSDLQFSRENNVQSVEDGDLLVRKQCRNKKRKRSVQISSQTIAKHGESSVPRKNKVCGVVREEDQENLEHNAARMLFSRFGPICNGISSNGKVSTMKTENQLPFYVSNGRDRVCGAAAEMEPAFDKASRILRPRKQGKKKGFQRKRRHFYELIFRGLDPYWILHRRIKVFWPLDQIWYFGLVNGYDPERKLHHIKYDDRDEEWIDLQNERFKLLLLPNEVPDNSDREKSHNDIKVADEIKRKFTTNEDGYSGCCMDSEPIISWLARSSSRIKSSYLDVSNIHEHFRSSPDLKPTVCDRTVGDTACSSRRRLIELPDRVNHKSEADKLSLVYYRKRYHNRDFLVHPKLDAEADERIVLDSSFGTGSVQKLFGVEISVVPSVNGDPAKPSQDINNIQLFPLRLPLLRLERCNFLMDFSVSAALNYLLPMQEFLLFRTSMLLLYGKMMSLWPMIHMQILLVDNIIGLKFFLFRGCLRQAVNFLVFAITTLDLSCDKGDAVSIPVTSICFRLSFSHDFSQQLVFGLYSFSTVRASKCPSLSAKFKKHCLLMKHLRLSECTHDNITHGSRFSGAPHVSGKDQVGAQLISWKIFGTDVPITFPCPTTRKSNMDDKFDEVPIFGFSYSVAPTFFLALHLQQLMKHDVSKIGLQREGLLSFRKLAESNLDVEEGSVVEERSSEVSENTPFSESTTSLMLSSHNEQLSGEKANNILDVTVVHFDGTWLKSLPHTESRNAEYYANISNPTRSGIEQSIYSAADHCEPSFPSPYLDVQHFEGPSETVQGSSVDDMSVEIQERNGEEVLDARKYVKRCQSFDMSPKMCNSLCSSNPTAPRSMWNRSRSTSCSSFGNLVYGVPNGSSGFVRNGFSDRVKKQRTHMSYTSFFGCSINSSTYGRVERGCVSQKRLRRSEKRAEGSRSFNKDLESSFCDANILITSSDRCWREIDAKVELELVDHNEWVLVARLSGGRRYSYKAHQFLQPGTTNRYTHDMMWKGGKDWILEFPDRTQWALFKEMHDECYNRNVRATFVRNIPIPGVRLIEDIDDNKAEVPFSRCPLMYFQQLETDVEMALSSSRILYDMDSDDEEWILEARNSLDLNSGSGSISEEMFEKAMDILEKNAFNKQCDCFTSPEVHELMDGIGAKEVAETLYEYWRGKRRRKGMPLIRQFQPPLWEKYQQLMKEWELGRIKPTSNTSGGCTETLADSGKPQMFAFCLKPRGLEVSSRGSTNRSQKKLSVIVQGPGFPDHVGTPHIIGRKISGYGFRDERLMYHGHVPECSDTSPAAQTCSRVNSLCESGAPSSFLSSTCNFYGRNLSSKFHRSKSKNIRSLLATQTANPMTPRRTQQLSPSDWSDHRVHATEALTDSDIEEFRLRDASAAAQHALNMAKLKRQNAQRLLYIADLAVHKAMVALTIAEAIKASSANE